MLEYYEIKYMNVLNFFVQGTKCRA